MHLYFWQNQISIHQSALLAQLSTSGHFVTLVVDERLLANRKQMGWPEPKLPHVRIIPAPSASEIAKISRESQKDSIHVLSGIRGVKVVDQALPILTSLGRHVGIQCERVDDRGLRGIAKRAFYRVKARQLRDKISFVLASGSHHWFEMIGFHANRVFPFCYVLEDAKELINPPVSNGGQYRIVFLGSLEPWKGPDLLLRAFQEAQKAISPSQQVTLTYVGDGRMKSWLSRCAGEPPSNHAVHFVGARPHNEAMSILTGMDLLVAPSRYDGWCAVVNEALMRGVPVLCSDACGASDLMRFPALGSVFQSENITSLTDNLLKELKAGASDPIRRDWILRQATRFSREAISDYLTRIIEAAVWNGARPSAPWYSSASEGKIP